MTAKAPECPVYRPTLQEVNGLSFVEYVERLEKQKAFREAGICKIVAPDGWAPRRTGYNRLNIELPRPIRQHATGRAGLYRTLMVEARRMPLDEFRDMAKIELNAAPSGAAPEELERQFWRNVTLNPPLYGADVPGSLFDPQIKGWTLRRLRSLLSDTLDEHGIKMPGVNEPYLYVGSWRSVFAWHTEDMDLHSVNYLHCGASKQWYVIPPAHRQRFEQLMRSLLQDLFRACPEFMRHKELLVSPQLLASHAIPVVRVVHNPREFVVVYPGAYHSGFNHGFNIAESVNFATKAWLPIGLHAGYCECQADSAKIDMRLFAPHMPAKLRREVAELYATSSDDDEEEEEDSEEESEGEEGEEGSSGDSSSEAEEEEAASGSGGNDAASSSSGEEEEEEAPRARKRQRRQPQPKRQRQKQQRWRQRQEAAAAEEEVESTSNAGSDEKREGAAAAKHSHGGMAAAPAAAPAPASGRPQRSRRPPRRDLDMMPIRLRPPPAAAAAAAAAAGGSAQPSKPGSQQPGSAAAARGRMQQPAAPPPKQQGGGSGAAAAAGSRKRSRSRSLHAKKVAPPAAAAAGAANGKKVIVGTSSRGRPLLLKVLDLRPHAFSSYR